MVSRSSFAGEGEEKMLHCAIFLRSFGIINHLHPLHFSYCFFAVESYNGSSLRLPRLERRQMGPYLCIAQNDVPPAVSKRVLLNVHCELMNSN